VRAICSNKHQKLKRLQQQVFNLAKAMITHPSGVSHTRGARSSRGTPSAVEQFHWDKGEVDAEEEQENEQMRSISVGHLHEGGKIEKEAKEFKAPSVYDAGYVFPGDKEENEFEGPRYEHERGEGNMISYLAPHNRPNTTIGAVFELLEELPQMQQVAVMVACWGNNPLCPRVHFTCLILSSPRLLSSTARPATDCEAHL